MAIACAVADLDRLLQAAGIEERAVNEKRYLKSDLEFYGVTVPARNRIVRSWLASLDDISHDDIVALVEELWSIPVHERRGAGVYVLELRLDRLQPRDIVLVERLLREARTWAIVDELAASVAGPLLDRHPDADALLDRWARDDDFWIRRAALLAHLLALRAGGGDFDRFTRYADAMLEEKEFFIRKAIGWILRDTARRRPDMVFRWILPRAARASGVTIREVVKRLPPEQAEAVTAAYRAAR
ncbi:MAG TPA: DNA alkylation repair protein [Acidimicrobiia bacterium]|nr:DNA alkylation repair protein [Acidimicrobiia bacterium]